MQDKQMKDSRVCNLTRGGNRNSSVELLRIVTMLCIVAHHYIVNSGILEEINRDNVMTFPAIFSLLFGWGGKTGINCFLLITGYFMCKSNIKPRKYLKLVLEIEFYNIMVNLVFWVSGYASFSVKKMVKALLPVYGIGTGFTGSYLVFYLFIPYINLLIRAMNQVQHLVLAGLALLTGTFLQTFLKAPEAFTYVGWFIVLYVIAAYIRLYPNKIFENQKWCTLALIISLLLSWGSVVAGAWVYARWNMQIYYYFVSDSNKLLAVITAISAFLVFKNLKCEYCSFINKIAASTFAVLMIHANNDTMRQWLWGDLLHNAMVYHRDYYIIHALVAVLGVYSICTIIDMVRIHIFEKPFFIWYDRILNDKLMGIITKRKEYW